MNAVLWSAATLLVYVLASALFARSGRRLWALPVLSGSLAVAALLWGLRQPYADYAQATGLLRALGGPAIVSLAVPLYRHSAALRRVSLPLLAALGVGCTVSALGTWALLSGLGLPAAVAASLAPKSATMPVAMAAAQRLGGWPGLAAAAVVITGLAGTWLTPWTMRLLGLRDPRVAAFTLGLAAHAIGTARVIQTQPGQLAYAAWAMGLNGVATAVVVSVLASGR